MDQNKNEASSAIIGHEPYEFTPAQNEVIGELGNSLKWVSIPIFALGAFCLMNFIFFLMLAFKTGNLTNWHSFAVGLLLIMQFLFFLLMARWTTTASLGFHAITQTKGKDISFLMIALNNLRAMFSVLAFCVKAFLIISIISLIMNLIHYYNSEPLVKPTPAATSPTPSNQAK
ncbi:MAG: hypothetical protein JNJ77_07310 [Planctomycetia bacterium]|nr:hypothetical protein [Planctomycetia bacterium]